MEKVSQKVVFDKDEKGMEKVMTNNDDGIYDLVTCLDCPEVSEDIHLKRLDNPDNPSHRLDQNQIIFEQSIHTGFHWI